MSDKEREPVLPVAACSETSLSQFWNYSFRCLCSVIVRLYPAAVICSTVVQLTLNFYFFIIFIKDNLNPSLFTEVVGLSCAIEKQINIRSVCS